MNEPITLTRRQLEVLAAGAGWLYTSLVSPDSRLVQMDDIHCTRLLGELEAIILLFAEHGLAGDVELDKPELPWKC